jgi:hypothetical protein
VGTGAAASDWAGAEASMLLRASVHASNDLSSLWRYVVLLMLLLRRLDGLSLLTVDGSDDGSKLALPARVVADVFSTILSSLLIVTVIGPV